MSQENVEAVRAIYEDWLRGDYEAVCARLDADIEWFGPPDLSASREPGSGPSFSFELRQLIDSGMTYCPKAGSAVAGRPVALRFLR